MYNITTIAGDGIGKEVINAGIAILDHLDLNINYIEAEAGLETFEKTGTTIPEETVKSAKKSDATLFGAITSVAGEKSPILRLRKSLDLYCNLRPVKSFNGTKSIKPNIDFLIIRENTEGLYCQVESLYENEAIAQRQITRKASERISKFGFEIAKKYNKKSVSCIHKANVLKLTDGLFKESFYKIAKNYPDINANDYYVDAMAMFLVTKPKEFDVIVTTNLFGDILSDEAAGLVGGLGLLPSGNIGDKNGLFEPVHGSAPDIAGKNISNPVATILSIAMMLDFLKEEYVANKIQIAVENVLKHGKIQTPDLGGTNKTNEMTTEIIKELDNL
ncbi:homoisocitrate dehydrogenase [Methanobrevibacter curvatus]|uniref:Homoisocitrate dehydrogenase n=1 Tax=Methanobrevibacter curvatus TaxID=49547 RepID=A0A166BBV4_9EURY|nr:homoisocitrate dehydrogenase [Methanobrevibacter curvatus]KZX13124.1 homoisocitrate dehydrogenase [Methanobrevibacter curvatus]